MLVPKAFSLMLLTVYAEGLAINERTANDIQRRGSWTSLGCYTDNESGRALGNQESISGGSGAMTNEACQSACLTANYGFAGTEYAGECRCGNSITNGGAPTASGCDMACNGASSEICGGPNRLTVYQYSSSGGGSGSPPTSSGKRGLAYNNNNPSSDATYANLFTGYSKITWGYDWGHPSWGLTSSFEFVPMLWGLPSGSDPNWTAAVKTAGTKNILGFNEPDLTYPESSNILPAAAAAGYKTYMEPFAGQVRIGLPNVLWNNHGSSSGGNYDSATWARYFMGNCTGCHFDFAAIHWYQDCVPGGGESGSDWFKSNVTNAYDTLGLPVWVTEFQCYGSEEQQITFLQAVLPWLDSQSYVEQYAYFGVFPGFLVNDAGNGPSNLGLVYATT